MKEHFNISVIGTGHLGSIHAKLWKASPNAKLIGIFDADIEKASSISKQNNCRMFGSLDEAIQSSDAVTIAVPTSLHYDVALQCIQQGVHCLIEKPITSEYEQALELINLAKENNVILQVGHVERFNPALASLSKYKINPRFIEAHRLTQFRPRATDVSVIHDLMIHDIDIVLWLTKSKVKKIDANGVSILTNTVDIANARLSFENGAVANLTASRISARPMRKMRIFQTGAYISIDFGNQDVEVFRLADSSGSDDNSTPADMLGTIDSGLNNQKIVYEKPEVITGNAIAEEQESFINSIINKAPVAVTADDAAEALRIAELIQGIIIQQ